MLALEACACQLVVGRLARTVAIGNGGCTIGAAAGDSRIVHLARKGIGQADNDHAVMQQHGMGGQNRAFLPAMLGGTGSKHAADFADQLALKPQGAGLVEEVFHLGGHIAETGRHADDDGIVFGQFIDGGNRGGLVELEMDALGHVFGHQFGHALDDRFGTGLAHAFGHGRGHGFDMAIARIIENQNFCHGKIPFLYEIIVRRGRTSDIRFCRHGRRGLQDPRFREPRHLRHVNRCR